jgi:hypothetical protein
VSCTYKIRREGGQWRPREDHKGKRRTHKQRHVTCRHTAIKHDEGKIIKERDGHTNKDTLLAGTRPLSMTKVGVLALEYLTFHMQKHSNGEIGQDDHLQSINAELSNEVICS